MSRYTEHTSKAMAAACVHSSNIIQAAVRAHDSEGERRMVFLLSAEEDAADLLASIKNAISIERGDA
jgi:hypothetical protein